MGKSKSRSQKTVKPEPLLDPNSAHWLCFLLSAKDEQLLKYASASGVSIDDLRCYQAGIRASMGVMKYRKFAWELKPCHKGVRDRALQTALARLGLHPKPWHHWRSILMDFEVAWKIGFNDAGYMCECSLWDSEGKLLPSLPWGFVEFRGVYYTDMRRGAPKDWIPYLYFEKADCGDVCDCSPDEGCTFCSLEYWLLPAKMVCGLRTSDHVMRLLTLTQIGRGENSTQLVKLTPALVGKIGEYLW